MEQFLDDDLAAEGSRLGQESGIKGGPAGGRTARSPMLMRNGCCPAFSSTRSCSALSQLKTFTALG